MVLGLGMGGLQDCVDAFEEGLSVVGVDGGLGDSWVLGEVALAPSVSDA